MSGPTTVEAAGGPDSSVQDWAAEWRNQASTSVCGTCLGGACGICSIRVGGNPKADGQPTGYVPRALQLYKPDEIPVSAINNLDMAGFARSRPRRVWCVKAQRDQLGRRPLQPYSQMRSSLKT